MNNASYITLSSLLLALVTVSSSRPTPRWGQMPDALSSYPAIATFFGRSGAATTSRNTTTTSRNTTTTTTTAAAAVGKGTISSVGHLSEYLHPAELPPGRDTATHHVFPIDNASWVESQEPPYSPPVGNTGGSMPQRAKTKGARGMAAERR